MDRRTVFPILLALLMPFLGGCTRSLMEDSWPVPPDDIVNYPPRSWRQTQQNLNSCRLLRKMRKDCEYSSTSTALTAVRETGAAVISPQWGLLQP